MQKTIYLDNNATTQVSDAVRDEMLPFFGEMYGNPSSSHAKGREAKKHLENARERVARFFNCAPVEVIFTSCGSESNNLAIKGTFFSSLKKSPHIITCKTEHPSVINPCEALKAFGAKVSYLDVDSSGFIDLDNLREKINDDTLLISIMLANNETGVINDIKAISKIASERGVLLHTDAVQAVGKVSIDVGELGADMLSISGHKFHAPKGVGALFVKKGLALKSIIDGGGQEFSIRAGTENIPYIVGIGKACEIAHENIITISEHLLALKKEFYAKITQNIEGVSLNGDFEKSLPNTLNLSFKGINAQSLMINLDLNGVMVSSGSACSSGAPKASHVLKAMHLSDERLKCVLRISFSALNTLDEVIRAADILIDTIKKLKNG